MANQLIGKLNLTRRNLKIFITPIQAILPAELNAETIGRKSDDDLIEETQVLFDSRIPFVRSYNSLLKLHEQFDTFRSNSQSEQREFEKYSSATGDYTQELSAASELLSTLDSTLEKMMSEGQSRNLPMAELNDDMLTTTTGKSHEPFHLNRPTIRNSSIQLSSNIQINAPSHPPTATVDRTDELVPETTQVFVHNDSSAFVTASLLGKNLPQFSGSDILLWPEFFESFNSLIRHGRITGSDKLALLRMCLSGEAQQIISGFSQIDSHYDHAISLLKKEYDRPHLRHHSLLSKLRNLPQCNNEETNLRSLYLQLNVIIRQLLPNGEIDSPDLLINLITSKLSTRMQTRIIKESSRKPNFGVFNVISIIADTVDDERIEKEIMAKENADELPLTRPTTPIMKDSSDDPPQYRFTNHPPPRRCRLCDGPHFEQHCTEYTTPGDRSTVVMQRRLRANCFIPGHISSHCRSHHRCHKCNGIHHTSICTYSLQVQQTSNSSRFLTASTPSKVKPTAPAKFTTNFVRTDTFFDDYHLS